MLRYTKQYFILFVFLFTIPISSQPGLKGGISISALQSSKEDFRPFLGYEVSWLQDGVSNPTLGLQLGAFYTFKFSDAFNLQPEIYFSQRGYQLDQTPLYNANYSLQINYFELSGLLEYYLPLSWSFHPVIMVGPFAAIKLSSNKKIRILDERISSDISSIKASDYGLVFGLGSEFNAWGGQVIFDLRINWGFSNIMLQPDDFINLSDDPGEVKTRAITLMTGYRFNLNW